MDSKTFLIPTMTEADARLVETELEQISGVRDVRIHTPTHSVTVTWAAPATWDDIGRRLAELQFTPDYPQSW
jgi:hypothetical protein